VFEYGALSVASDVAFWSLGLANPNYPVEQLGQLSLEISSKFRTLAIIQLLTEGSTDLFLHNLMRSGRARETYLKRILHARLPDDHHRASGRYRPLLDAIAANHLVGARHITQLVPSHFRAWHEYEDDYCYAQLLARLISDQPVPEAELEALLQQFDAWLDGVIDARYLVCHALVERDQAAFEAAFEDILLAHEMAIEADNARHRHEDDEFRAEKLVSIEGLALLRIAELRGLQTATHYRYCPSLARLPMRHPFPAV
jgi:hypothetical protein